MPNTDILRNTPVGVASLNPASLDLIVWGKLLFFVSGLSLFGQKRELSHSLILPGFR